MARICSAAKDAAEFEILMLYAMERSMSHSLQDDSTFQYADWPFYWLTRVADRYVAQLEVSLKALGLDVPRWRVLMQLKDDACLSVSELAEHAIAKLPTMTKIIQRMDADGQVSCRPRATDGRVTEVMSTAKGRRARHKAWLQANVIYERAFATMSDEQARTLTSLLNQLFAGLELPPSTADKKRKR
jgi:MarR family transcriptional regulator, organic hydroperoxide resistance regulator